MLPLPVFSAVVCHNIIAMYFLFFLLSMFFGQFKLGVNVLLVISAVFFFFYY